MHSSSLVTKLHAYRGIRYLDWLEARWRERLRSLLCHRVVEEGKQERKRVQEEERVRGTRGREERHRGASPKCGDRRPKLTIVYRFVCCSPLDPWILFLIVLTFQVW